MIKINGYNKYNYFRMSDTIETVITNPQLQPSPSPPTREYEKNKKILNTSFTITYRLLLIAFIVSFFTSLMIPSQKMRLILYLECGITFVAAFMYSIFIRSIYDKHSAADTLHSLFGFSSSNSIENINILRYVGWSISTALMLCALCFVLAFNLNITASIQTIATVVVLDWMMLMFGFLGESRYLDMSIAWVLGFIPFFIMFYVIYDIFIKEKTNDKNKFIFCLYFILWLMYGLVYLIDETTKTVITNILDCIAKAFFAIGLSISFLMK
jgi:hypothetical protein